MFNSSYSSFSSLIYTVFSRDFHRRRLFSFQILMNVLIQAFVVLRQFVKTLQDPTFVNARKASLEMEDLAQVFLRWRRIKKDYLIKFNSKNLYSRFLTQYSKPFKCKNNVGSYFCECFHGYKWRHSSCRGKSWSNGEALAFWEMVSCINSIYDVIFCRYKRVLKEEHVPS
jgi:hypothetical protein